MMMNKFLVLSIVTFLSLLVVSPVSAFSFSDLINVFLPQDNEKVVLNLDDGEVLNSEKYLSNDIKKKSERVKIETQTKKIDNKKKSVKFLEKEQNIGNNNINIGGLSSSSSVNDEVISKNEELNVDFRITDIVVINNNRRNGNTDSNYDYKGKYVKFFFEFEGDVENINSYKGDLSLYVNGLFKITSHDFDIYDYQGNLKSSHIFSLGADFISDRGIFTLGSHEIKIVFEPYIPDNDLSNNIFIESFNNEQTVDLSIEKIDFSLSNEQVVLSIKDLQNVGGLHNINIRIEGPSFSCELEDNDFYVHHTAINYKYYHFSSCGINLTEVYNSEYFIFASIDVKYKDYAVDSNLDNNVASISFENTVGIPIPEDQFLDSGVDFYIINIVVSEEEDYSKQYTEVFFDFKGTKNFEEYKGSIELYVNDNFILEENNIDFNQKSFTFTNSPIFGKNNFKAVLRPYFEDENITNNEYSKEFNVFKENDLFINFNLEEKRIAVSVGNLENRNFDYSYYFWLIMEGPNVYCRILGQYGIEKGKFGYTNGYLYSESKKFYHHPYFSLCGEDFNHFMDNVEYTITAYIENPGQYNVDYDLSNNVFSKSFIFGNEGNIIDSVIYSKIVSSKAVDNNDHRTTPDSILRDSGEAYEDYLNEQKSSGIITPSSYVIRKEVDDVSCDFLPEKIRKIEEPLCNKAENDDEVINDNFKLRNKVVEDNNFRRDDYTSIPARFR